MLFVVVEQQLNVTYFIRRDLASNPHMYVFGKRVTGQFTRSFCKVQEGGKKAIGGWFCQTRIACMCKHSAPHGTWWLHLFVNECHCHLGQVIFVAWCYAALPLLITGSAGSKEAPEGDLDAGGFHGESSVRLQFSGLMTWVGARLRYGSIFRSYRRSNSVVMVSWWRRVFEGFRKGDIAIILQIRQRIVL